MEKVLPKGWVETELGNVALISSGYGFPIKYQGNLDYPIPFYKVGDISANVKQGKVYLQKANNYINKQILTEIKGKLCPSGSIVFAKIGEAIRLNRRSILSEDSVVDNNVMSITYFQYINNKYGFYYFQTLNLIDLSAGNAVPSIRKSTVEEISFPLPPLTEQERIVAKLDKLFAQHELMKKALDRIPQLLKDFRQQVLTQAVTGKLTEKWREGKELEDWTTPMLKDVCFGFKYGSSSKSDDEGNVAVLRMGNLQNGKLDLSDLKYSNNMAEIQKYFLEPGDVLFNRTNSPELVGKTSIYKGEIPAIYAGYLIKIENDRTILDSDYLNFYMNTPQVRTWCNEVKSDGVSQSNINAKKLADLAIPLPTLQEQQEIVSRVESLFAKADAIESRYQILKAKIDSLPQAFLHKAFKGELVPQLPSDGDAKDLLAEIIALKNETKAKGKRVNK